MAKEYILIKEKSDFGIIALNKSVFAGLVAISEDEIEGVIKIHPTRFYNPVQVRIVNNKLLISVDIHLKFGCNVSLVCKRLQSKIYDNILLSTNIKPSEITVNILSFSV